MHISHVSISQILGIENLQFEAGTFNRITGENGQGKTSILEAIKSGVGQGEDATLLRRGAEKGEIVLVLDDGMTITKTITATGSTVIAEKDGKRVPNARTHIKKLTEMFSLNPIEFLRARDKDRVSVLLDSLPMKADPDRLLEIAGPVAKIADPDAHALIQIEAIYKVIYDDRTGTNRAISEKDSTINQLSLTLPSDSEDVPAGDAEALEAKLAEINAECDVKLEQFSTKLTGYRAESQARADAIQVEIDAARERLQAEKDWMASTETKAAGARTAATEARDAARVPVQAALTAIRQGEEAIIKAQVTRATIDTMGKEALGLRQDAANQTAALAALEAYKSELLADLPIDGLTVRDGKVFRHEVPFDRLNTEQQVDIAVEIAKLRAGELGLICVDGLELLDSAHFRAFEERSRSSGLQLFVTRVADSELAVEAAA